jgi:hypothetical protein
VKQRVQPETCGFAELLIDCEEYRALRAELVGMLREGSACNSLSRIKRRIGSPRRRAKRRSSVRQATLVACVAPWGNGKLQGAGRDRVYFTRSTTPLSSWPMACH